MKYLRVLMLLPFIAFFIVDCGHETDEEAIQALLESSWYIGNGAVQIADQGTNNPGSLSGLSILADTIPWVRWVRFIERPVTWNFEIVVNDDSADVTITGYFQGEPPYYGLFVRNEPGGPVYARAITDSVVRRVKCYRDDDGWHLASLTVGDIYTVNADHPVTITEVRAEVESRQYVFIVDDENTYFEKDELPIFYPSDTVEVTVICSAEGDSTWAFLHHGAGHRQGVGLRPHHRDPFYRENTTTFTRTWIIADDSVVTTPAVRHSAADVLGWETLFGDSLARYYAHAWTLPYIVMEPGEEIPDD
ncbi:MAG: hypothetical protein JSV97_03565 [candidate division WOR-3 bacterium]|nr:MAG: hypothetical protein JSV97_03565 [candidate division WOR-3 bacterium]